MEQGRAMAVKKQVPHLRWSQAPFLPSPRQGSADIHNDVCVPQWYENPVGNHLIFSMLATLYQTPCFLFAMGNLCGAASDEVP